MRCTSCSTKLKPVVAIDIDGTLGDYHSHFIRFAEDYLDRFGASDDVATYDGSGSFREWGRYQWDIDDTQWSLVKLAYRQGGMKRTMPAYGGATALGCRVREAGAELWLTTTRPHLRLDGVDPDTREWLRRNAIGYDGLLYDEDKYRVLAERVDHERVVAVLDDLPEQIDAARAAFGEGVPILRRQRYNRGVMFGPEQAVAKDLDQAWVQIAQRIHAWKEAHDE